MDIVLTALGVLLGYAGPSLLLFVLMALPSPKEK